MKCTGCGFESEQEFERCPCCGALGGVEAPTVSTPAGEKMLSVLKDNLFLAICILISCSCLFSFSGGGIPVLNVLYTVFFWLIFAQSRKGIADAKYLRCVSGTVYASYVITNVVSIIAIVCGIIGFVALSAVGTTEMVYGMLSGIFGMISSAIISLPFEWISVIGALLLLGIAVVGIAVLVLNILGMRKIHLFAKSVYKSIETGSFELASPIAARNWLIFFAVSSGINALSVLSQNLVSALSSGCTAATIILAVILINKYLLQKD